MSRLEDFRRRADLRLAELRSAEDRLQKERAERESLRARLRILEEAQSLAQSVAEAVQNRGCERIAQLVTRCLGIFDEPYTFQIKVERARGRTEARLLLVRDGVEVDPQSGAGGGVLDVAAFALRVACLVLRRPPLRRFLCLDEPFRFVSEEYRPRVRSLLESLSKELGVQFLIVTHDPLLQTGQVVRIGD